MAILLDRVLSPPEIISLEMILGSDIKRGAMNLSRWLGFKNKKIHPYWKTRWNLLYKDKL